MKRPWQVWLVFVACVALGAVAMVWLTRQALRADRLRGAAEAEAELEQRVSLALWRMDTELAPIIAEEVIRPSAAYRPGKEAMPPPAYVLLQFEARGDGIWRSPQLLASQSGDSPRLAELRKTVALPDLLADLPDTPLPTPAQVAQNLVAANADGAEQLDDSEDQFHYFEGNRASLSPKEPAQQVEKPIGKQVAKAADFEQRGKRYQSAAQQSLMNVQQRERQAANAPDLFGPPSDDDFATQSPASEQVGVSRPVWIGERLILARRVNEGGETFVQGCWLDWPALKTRLLAETKDLLPGADLVPAKGDANADPSRMLAGLPVRLVAGEAPAMAEISTTLGWSLWMGWGAVLVAATASAVLLHGVMTLSERRAAFVSSVTHELRTPLTTFRMYSEMLARGMVPDAERRQEYFNTLQREAERLTLLVENVLAYARLERGRKPHAQDRVSLATLLDRVGPRLKQRAEQADMKCEVQLDPSAAQQEFTTDQSVVEQILFNLVDNAAKYACEASDRQIHVEASRNGQWVRLVVRDHGPGIQQGAFDRRMQAFGKSAQESAETAPGVGLGLALCRRLARQLGGRLEIDTTNGGGASVSLILPISQHHAARLSNHGDYPRTGG